MSQSSPTVYAHRGASLELPENTLEAFALAISLGANAIETDVHMTADGHIVIAHDPIGERTAGVSAWICKSRLADVQSWNVAASFRPARPGLFDAAVPYRIPTLAEALSRFSEVFFNVDAKGAGDTFIEELVRVVRHAKATDRVRIASFSRRNLRKARALGYEGATGLSPSEVALAVLSPPLLARHCSFSGDAAQIPERAHGIALSTPRVIDRLHSLGMRVDFWTINHRSDAERLFAMGADGIVTDDPREMIGLL